MKRIGILLLTLAMLLSLAACGAKDTQTIKAEEKQERNAIEGLILQLSDPDERAVIRLRYFDRADWESTCGVLFGDRRDYVDRVDAYQNRTYKIHGRALLNLAAVLDELEPLPELRQ